MLLCPYDDCNYHTERAFNLKRHTERHKAKKKPIEGYKCSQCSYESDRYHNALKHLQAIHRGKGSLVKFDKTEDQLHPEQKHKKKTPIEGYKCSLCPYESVRYHNGMKHLQAIHGGEGSLVQLEQKDRRKKPIERYKCSLCPYESVRYHNGVKHLQAIHGGEGSVVKFYKNHDQLQPGQATYREERFLVKFRTTEAPMHPEQKEKLDLNNGLEANPRLEQREEFQPNSELHREDVWEEPIELKQEPAWENRPKFEERLDLSTGLEEEKCDLDQREESELHREPECEEEMGVKQEPEAEYVEYVIVFQDDIEVKQEL